MFLPTNENFKNLTLQGAFEKIVLCQNSKVVFFRNLTGIKHDKKSGVSLFLLLSLVNSIVFSKTDFLEKELFTRGTRKVLKMKKSTWIYSSSYFSKSPKMQFFTMEGVEETVILGSRIP